MQQIQRGSSTGPLSMHNKNPITGIHFESIMTALNATISPVAHNTAQSAAERASTTAKSSGQRISRKVYNKKRLREISDFIDKLRRIAHPCALVVTVVAIRARINPLLFCFAVPGMGTKCSANAMSSRPPSASYHSCRNRTR